jgi:hypothetical protein
MYIKAKVDIYTRLIKKADVNKTYDLFLDQMSTFLDMIQSLVLKSKTYKDLPEQTKKQIENGLSIFLANYEKFKESFQKNPTSDGCINLKTQIDYMFKITKNQNWPSNFAQLIISQLESTYKEVTNSLMKLHDEISIQYGR